MSRLTLSSERLSPEADRAINSFHAGIVRSVQQAVERDRVVVVGMAQNPFVYKARKALNDAGISFTYLEYGSYLNQWKERLAIKLWSGWPTFPQVFVKGVLIGGANDTIRALQDGSLKKRLQG